METKWVHIGELLPSDEKQWDAETINAIKEAGRIIKMGGLVAFPTETVYGLGGDALNPDSSRKIYEAKGRPSDNPLIVHIAKMEDLEPLTAEIPEVARRLAEKYWPGPLTMIFKKSSIVPVETTGGLDTVAVRFPDHPAAQMFIREAGGYVAAPSANTSGRPSPTLGQYVYEDMQNKIEMLLDGGQVGIGIESTIIDVTEKIPVILRPGYITQEMLEELLGEVAIDQTILGGPDGGVAPRAPGMKYRHYAPKGELSLVEGNPLAVQKAINRMAQEKQEQGYLVGVIGTDETIAGYQANVKKSVGKREDEKSIAHRLYQILREFDREHVDYIYSESFSYTGVGQAIMNRLLKAAGHKIITVKEDIE